MPALPQPYNPEHKERQPWQRHQKDQERFARIGKAASASFPKFVIHLSNLLHEPSETRGHQQLYDSSAAFRFEVPNRACRRLCRNFKLTTLEGLLLGVLVARLALGLPAHF